jgi:hypothetical protein
MSQEARIEHQLVEIRDFAAGGGVLEQVITQVLRGVTPVATPESAGPRGEQCLGDLVLVAMLVVLSAGVPFILPQIVTKGPVVKPVYAAGGFS